MLKRAAPDPDEAMIDQVSSFLDVGYEDYEYTEKDPEEAFSQFIDATSNLLSERDIHEITTLRDLAKSIIEKGDSKLNALLSLLEDKMAEEGTKVILFTEYKDTLNYIIENLKKRHPEWSNNFLRLCSDESGDPRVFKKIRDSFEKNPKSRMLLATDVIAEGVNLQVAHILINYEVPWSLIELEQRIGRVWRLGQKKEVEAYTLFMDNVADSAALHSMYEKLLNLKRAALSPKPVTGQEVLLYADAENIIKMPPTVSTYDSKGKKHFQKVTEEKAILTYLRENEEGLSRLIASIISARQELEQEQTQKGILNKPKTREEVESTIHLLGFRDPASLMKSMKDLTISSSKILGFEVSDEGDYVKVSKGLEMPTNLGTLDDYFSYLTQPTQNDNYPRCIISYVGESCYITPVEIRDKKTGALLFREIIGIQPSQGSIIRGEELIKFISKTLTMCVGYPTAEMGHEDIPFSMIPEVLESTQKIDTRLMEPINTYKSTLINLRLREQYCSWIGVKDVDVKILPSIYMIQNAEQVEDEKDIPETIKKEIEEKAMEYVIKIEKDAGQIVENVSDKTH